MIEQTNLYEFTSLNDDPVFNRIKNLDIGQEIQIEAFNVRKTDKFYEVESEELHEGFKSLVRCYSFISSNI